MKLGLFCWEGWQTMVGWPAELVKAVAAGGVLVNVPWASYELAKGRYDAGQVERLLAPLIEKGCRIHLRLLTAGAGIQYGREFEETPAWLGNDALQATTGTLRPLTYREPCYWRERVGDLTCAALAELYGDARRIAGELVVSMAAPLGIWTEQTPVWHEIVGLRAAALTAGYDQVEQIKYFLRVTELVDRLINKDQRVVIAGGAWMHADGQWADDAFNMMPLDIDWLRKRVYLTAKPSPAGITEPIVREKIKYCGRQGLPLMLVESKPEDARDLALTLAELRKELPLLGAETVPATFFIQYQTITKIAKVEGLAMLLAPLQGGGLLD